MGATPPKPFAPPEAFDEFRLLHPIGRGGMGMVFLGHDVLLDRPVAVKFIAASEPQTRDLHRFQLEARAVARLQHPNVVSVYRVGVVEGRPYLVSELVRGQSLSRVKKPMPWQQALRIGIGLARGLAAAHRQGVLHRDIKPGNIMLTRDGEVKLLDFGLAKMVAALPGGPLSETHQPWAAPAVIGTPEPVPVPLVQGHDPLTEHGVVVGTPLYMAPETLHSEQATKRSDVYSLGAVLYEICTGEPPASASGSGSDTANICLPKDAGGEAPHEPAPLSQRAPGIDVRFAAAIMRCLRADPAQRFAGGDEVRDTLEQLVQDGPSATVPDGNPYRGLLAFGAEHRALFFGRRVEIGAILDKLRTEPMVLVAGDSGVGKSSLCRAGVLPLVVEGALEESRTFTVLRMVPGRHPLAELTGVLAPLLHLREEALASELSRDPAAVCRLLRRSLGRNLGLILFIDQLEELTTISALEEALLLGRVIAELATFSPALRLLCTARGDFLTRLAAIDGLGDEIVRSLYLLRPLSADGIREAIVGPAQRKQVVFEFEYMVQTLVESTTQAAGGLPLLQFALAELWDARDQVRGVIPDTALQTVGGVAGALSRHADGVLLGLTPPQRHAARRILTRLVTLDGTRARCVAADLGRDDAAQRGALEALVRGRLVVVSHSEGEPVYEMAHEALIEGWGTLHRWLEADADLRALVQRVQAGAAEWERLGRQPEALWGRRQLKEAAGLGEHDLPQREAAFLLASRRSVRRLRYLRGALVAALPVALLLGYGGYRLKVRLDLDRIISDKLAQAQQFMAQAQQLRQQGAAQRARALSLFDAGHKPAAGSVPGPGGGADPQEVAEAVWQRAQADQEEAESLYIDASQVLESALLMDAGRALVRGLLGDVTYQRVLLSESLHQDKARAEQVRRLSNYDLDGSRRRALRAPAVVRLRGAPQGSRVTLQRYDNRHGRRVLVPVTEQAGGGQAEMSLASGSYLITVSAPPAPVLLLPVLVQRGELLEVDLHVPAAVPAGYIYIPPGRFLYGSADPPEQRLGFYNAQPLHQIGTGGYLIGASEVTFAEWLEFLRDLPPAERAPRLPRVENIHGSLALSEGHDHVYQLTLRPTTTAYTAREGERIRYPARQQRAEQDWRRFPVSAISAEDGRAYASWLAHTGRLPGARLCDEREWERAARGADERIYPHGDVLAPDDANIDETYGRAPLGFGPDEVGSHPASDSPYGVHDLAGNVWELTTSALVAGEVVLRGGSFYQGGPTPRAMNREVGEPTLRNLQMGFRVCATYPQR